ncbi:hypothetical protein TIFTF001_043174 [Ficus carica]|uniref:Uncharacterized protein n=1 Tax=Ficus carica TaxID=3494 RepID=A0AA88CX01_FICCA|nr:hypothetical protein TIFTF001_043174 [Ficus carica]
MPIKKLVKFKLELESANPTRESKHARIPHVVHQPSDQAAIGQITRMQTTPDRSTPSSVSTGNCRFHYFAETEVFVSLLLYDSQSLTRV